MTFGLKIGDVVKTIGFGRVLPFESTFIVSISFFIEISVIGRLIQIGFRKIFLNRSRHRTRFPIAASPPVRFSCKRKCLRCLRIVVGLIVGRLDKKPLFMRAVRCLPRTFALIRRNIFVALHFAD